MSFQPIHEFQSCAINRARRLLHTWFNRSNSANYDIIRYFSEVVKWFLQIYSFLLPESAKMDFGGIFLILRLTNPKSGVSLDSELPFGTKVSLKWVLPKKLAGDISNNEQSRLGKEQSRPGGRLCYKIGKEKRRNKNMNVIKNTQLYYSRLSPKCQVLFLGIYEIRRDEYG